jgi:hypothetical protein
MALTVMLCNYRKSLHYPSSFYLKPNILVTVLCRHLQATPSQLGAMYRPSPRCIRRQRLALAIGLN